jgi:hypothetical protein
MQNKGIVGGEQQCPAGGEPAGSMISIYFVKQSGQAVTNFAESIRRRRFRASPSPSTQCSRAARKSGRNSFSSTVTTTQRGRNSFSSTVTKELRPL